MEFAGQHKQLEQIAQQLHGQLQTHRLEPEADVLRVQCAVKGDRFLVLVQHAATTPIESAQIFQCLEQSILAVPREWINALLPEVDAAAVPVKLYLREVGMPKPYAAHQFELGAVAPMLLDESLLELPPLDDIESPLDDIAPRADLDAAAGNTSADNTPADNAPAEHSALERSLVPQDESTRQRVFGALARPLAAIAQPAKSGSDEPGAEWFDGGWGWLAMGSVATVACVGTAAFMLSRPCVVGACQPLQIAAEVSQQLTEPALSVQRGDFQSVRAELLKVRKMLNTIPMWSSRYADAQAMMTGLDGAIVAERTAEQAHQKGQAAAQPVTEWQAAQSTWRTAIAQLGDIPKTNPMFGFAQKRLTTYRAHLVQVDRRVATEQEAHRRLLTAKKTAQLAETRQNGAHQLKELQSAESTWQVVVNTLRQTPPGTTTEAESQELLQSYQPKLDAARDRASQEHAARKAYFQALQFQKRARAHRQQNQWPQTATLLQSALTYAQQVPTGTTSFDLAQGMIPGLSADLEQAQAIVKSRLELSRVCAASGKICDYTIKPTGIQVKFTPTYEHRVNDLKASASQSASPETVEQVNQHIASLEAALQTVSNTAQVPIQVFSSSNQLVGSFSPGG
jgi:hypothetical protein